MLVLSRNIGEQIVIDNAITITVLCETSLWARLYVIGPTTIRGVSGTLVESLQPHSCAYPGSIFRCELLDVFALGTTISVQIASLEMGKMRFGIKAPRNITIDRRRVWEEKQQQQTEVQQDMPT